ARRLSPRSWCMACSRLSDPCSWPSGGPALEQRQPSRLRLVVSDSVLLLMRRASMNKRVCLLAAGGVLVALIAFLMSQGRSAGQNTTTAPGKAQPAKAAGDPGKTKRPDEKAAIRKATADFIKAVEKGDVKAVAAAWTEDGEYIDDDGTTIRGRAAIE